jgi:hypothetical protein
VWAVVEFARSSDLLQLTVLEYGNAVPMVIASIWPWVMWTVIVPSLDCRAAMLARVSMGSLASRFESGSS